MANFLYDTNVFRYFVKNNFQTVKDYLNNGIFDRDSIYGKTDWRGFRTFYKIKRFEYQIKPGEFLYDKDNGEMNFCLAKGERGKPNTYKSIKIIKSIRKPLKGDELQDNYSSNPDSIKAITRYVETENNGNLYRAEYYLSACLLNFDANDQDIWDSFFTLFAIAAAVGSKTEFESAPLDLQDAAGVVAELPKVSPIRFLIAQGDQFLKHIFTAFDLEGRVRPLDTKKGIDQAARLKTLKDLIRESEESDDIKSNCTRIQELLDMDRYIRNKEGHSQLLWDKPTDMIRWFILDHVMLIYMLKHALKLSIKDEFISDEIKQNLYIPVRLESGISVDTPQKGVVKSGNGSIFAMPFTDFKVGESNFSIARIDTSEFIIRKGNGSELSSESRRLADIARIDYNPLIESIQAQLAVLRSETVTQDELEKAREDITKKALEFYQKLEENVNKEIEGLNQQISQVLDTNEKQSKRLASLEKFKKQIEDSITNLEALIKSWVDDRVEYLIKKEAERSRRKKNIILLISAIIVTLAGSIIYMANARGLAVKDAFCYKLSQSFLNFCHDKGDISYDRGQHLDKQISDSLAGNIPITNDSVFMSLNPIRQQAAQAYRNAAASYTEALSLPRSKDTSKAAYRLALMSFTGRGGMPQDMKKTAEYASMTNTENTRGMRALFEYWATGDISVLRKDIPALRKAAPGDYFAPLAVAEYDMRFNIDSLESNLEKREVILKPYFDIYKSNNDASDLANMALYSYYVHIHDHFISMGILFQLAKDNCPIAQHALGERLLELRMWKTAIHQLLGAYLNGYEDAGYLAILGLRNSGMDDNDIFSEFPSLNDLKDKSNFYTDLESLKVKNLLDLSMEEKNALIDRKKYINVHKPININISYNKEFEDNLIITHPDSAAYILNNFDSFELHPKIAAIPGDMRSAVHDYITALYYEDGLGYFKRDSLLADSLLKSAATKGLPNAMQTRALKLFGNGKNPERTQEAITLMEKAAVHSDDAKIWLAERYRFINKDRSREMSSAITDTLHPYRLMREMDNITVSYKYSNDPKVADSLKSKYTKLFNDLNARVDFLKYANKNPKIISNIVLYLCYSLPENERDRIRFYQYLAMLFNGQYEMILRSFRTNATSFSQLPSLWRQYNASGVVKDISPWLRQNIENELNGIRHPMVYPTATQNWPVFINDYTTLSNLIVL